MPGFDIVLKDHRLRLKSRIPSATQLVVYVYPVSLIVCFLRSWCVAHLLLYSF